MEKGAETRLSSSLAATAMAIGGRAIRPCDVCGRERARWYCKADEAYLCKHCDASVHGANAVSLRHERVRLASNGTLMKNVRRVSSSSSHEDVDGVKDNTSPAAAGSSAVTPRKKLRSTRPHPGNNNNNKVKAEPRSPDFVHTPDLDANNAAEEESSRQVPIFDPLLEDFATSDDNSLGFEVPCAAPEENDEDMCFTVPAGVGVEEQHQQQQQHCDLHGFPDVEADLCDMDSIITGTIVMEDIDDDLNGFIGSNSPDDEEAFGVDFSDMTFRSPCSDYPSEVETPGGSGVGSSFSSARVKTEETEDLDRIKLEVDEMLGFAFSSVKEEEAEKKITLKLNYEDVLNAWSDRGPFWTEGPRPHTVPDESSFDPTSSLDTGLVPEYCIESTQADGVGQVPVVNFNEERMFARGGREARVMRYREKRRTRLFSKKIRYEVRKLNAERRPRLKGRFVKRTTS